MIDVEHRSLRAFEQNRFALASAWFSRTAVSQTNGAIFSAACAYSRIHLVGIERFGVEQRVRNHVLLAHGILDVLLQQLQVQQIGHAQAAAAHLVFVRRTDPARGGADLYPSRSIFRRQFDHAVVGKNHVRAVRNEEMAVDFARPPRAMRRLLSETPWDRALRHCR